MDEITWTAPEFEYQEHGPLWHVGVIVASALLLFIAVLQENLLFAVVIVIGSALIIALSDAKPHVNIISVSSRAVSIGNLRIYPLYELDAFAIGESGQRTPEWGKLVLRSKSRFRPLIKLPAPQGKLAQIREMLQKHLSEIPYEPSLWDEIATALKL